jgi:protein tyrosine/serine phosphatase
MVMSKKIIGCVLSLLLMLTGCTNHSNVSLDGKIYKDAKFDCADLTLNEEDLEKAGFEFGDSIDVEFSNGYSMPDVPYYNGYYVKTGEPVIVAYPNDDYVLIANNNADFWSIAGFENDMSVTLTLNEKGKYSDTYKALGQSYSTKRKEYSSDEVFANFRSLKDGNLKEHLIYRGASPVDNSRNRASYANKLIESVGVQCEIDLADSKEDMENYFSLDTFDSEYAKKLYEEENTIVLSMNSDIDSDIYMDGLKNAVEFMLSHSGPYYIHCMEGKDRTGFVCLVFEALAGANYNEMRKDYMTTYLNYYGISKSKTPEKYKAVVSLYFNGFLEDITGIRDDDQLKQMSYVDSAKDYLLDCGLTETEIEQFIHLITKE